MKMKEILLSKEGKNRGKYVALVDDEDFERVNQFNWYVRITKHTNYAGMFVCENGNKHSITLHQFILDRKLIDHTDHNGLNCQKYNLRFCTQLQNNMNKRAYKNTSSKYKGVSKYRGKWDAQISFNYKNIHLGLYQDEMDAAKACNKKDLTLNEVFV